MSIIRDLIENVVGGALGEVLRKTGASTGKRRRRRTKGPANAALRTLEKLLRPVQKRQVSRRRTVRARSKAKRRSG